MNNNSKRLTEEEINKIRQKIDNEPEIVLTKEDLDRLYDDYKKSRYHTSDLDRFFNSIYDK